ncbi:hypothetical protein GCM10007388_51200 [Pseudoduganella plicata]|uniref:PLD phosphodiesterase domain-containing protein n=1 Tax=Pseudoduganella plicata TaxID=321984 RepID=A0AA88CB05_9BURK|nr:hypothetical protein GCM10007388_51200 [Pseudoduganella plicata]
MAQSFREARSFIMITDWQLDYDVELDQRGTSEHKGRLSALLADAVKRGVHVRIMLYDAVNPMLDTHEEIAQEVFGKIPDGRGSVEVLLANPNTGRSAIGAYNIPRNGKRIVKHMNCFFSHHQKSVVVDGHIAYVGGLDLAYGRWDTNSFDVVIDRKIHVLNDAYNSQLVPGREMSSQELQLVGPYRSYRTFEKSLSGGKLFDETCQPRQPWQDVAVQILGPAAFDVFNNFVLRWNSFAGTDTNFLDGSMRAGWFKRANGPDLLADPLQRGQGTAAVQICRSASSQQLRDELKLWGDRYEFINDDWNTRNTERRKIVQKARQDWCTEHQTSILDAMVNSIRSARGFIYIENQFFMSECGVDRNGRKCPSENKIIAELANAVGQAIHAGRPFHIWLVLPEHPEGLMEAAATSSQTWWALQGVMGASGSLVKRINNSIVRKNSKKWGLDSGPVPLAAQESLLAKYGMTNEWKKYLTVLNLRNYGCTDRCVLTEMVYVHSKLLIVDDAVAIIGSANINDRSLLGNGDTELAAVIVDEAEAKMTDVGGGIRLPTRKFARDLRMSQWRKHLGMLVDVKTTGVQRARTAPSGVDIEKPLSDSSITGIRRLSEANRNAYSEVFLHTPRDSHKTLTEGRELAFPLKIGSVERDFSTVPKLQPKYMVHKRVRLPSVIPSATSEQSSHDVILSTHNVADAIRYLRDNVHGFFVAMPLHWASYQTETPLAPAADSMIAANGLEAKEAIV